MHRVTFSLSMARSLSGPSSTHAMRNLSRTTTSIPADDSGHFRNDIDLKDRVLVELVCVKWLYVPTLSLLDFDSQLGCDVRRIYITIAISDGRKA